MILVNAFSLNMLATPECTIKVRPLSLRQARRLYLVDCHQESAVGHVDTAAIFETELNSLYEGSAETSSIDCERRTISIGPGDSLLVGQYHGPRLEAGTTKLPEGATIEWKEVTILP